MERRTKRVRDCDATYTRVGHATVVGCVTPTYHMCEDPSRHCGLPIPWQAGSTAPRRWRTTVARLSPELVGVGPREDTRLEEYTSKLVRRTMEAASASSVALAAVQRREGTHHTGQLARRTTEAALLAVEAAAAVERREGIHNTGQQLVRRTTEAASALLAVEAAAAVGRREGTHLENHADEPVLLPSKLVLQRGEPRRLRPHEGLGKMLPFLATSWRESREKGGGARTTTTRATVRQPRTKQMQHLEERQHA